MFKRLKPNTLLTVLICYLVSLADLPVWSGPFSPVLLEATTLTDKRLSSLKASTPQKRTFSQTISLTKILTKAVKNLVPKALIPTLTKKKALTFTLN
jgi:hypothetical protein